MVGSLCCSYVARFGCWFEPFDSYIRVYVCMYVCKYVCIENCYCEFGNFCVCVTGNVKYGVCVYICL
jgi:hypothetical protein